MPRSRSTKKRAQQAQWIIELFRSDFAAKIFAIIAFYSKSSLRLRYVCAKKKSQKCGTQGVGCLQTFHCPSQRTHWLTATWTLLEHTHSRTHFRNDTEWTQARLIVQRKRSKRPESNSFQFVWFQKEKFRTLSWSACNQRHVSIFIYSV